MRQVIAHRRWLTIAAATALIVAAGCASLSTSKGLIVSGALLRATGQDFLVASTKFTDGCVAKQIKVADCAAFTKFSGKFKAAWPPAVQLWNAAVAADDARLKDQAEEAILDLVTELSSIALQVGVKVGG